MSLEIYQDAVLADNPALFWPGQETSGMMQDISGNGRHADTGSVSNYENAGPVDGVVAVGLDTTQQKRATSWTTQVDDWTMETWFQMLAGTGLLHYMGNGGTNGYGTVMDVVDGSFRGLAGGVSYLSYGSGTIPISFPVLPPWMQFVTRRSGGVWSYFIDGAVNTANAGNSTPVAPDDGGRIGSGTQAMYVCMHSITLSALSDARIAERYDAMFATGVDVAWIKA